MEKFVRKPEMSPFNSPTVVNAERSKELQIVGGKVCYPGDWVLFVILGVIDPAMGKLSCLTDAEFKASWMPFDEFNSKYDAEGYKRVQRQHHPRQTE